MFDFLSHSFGEFTAGWLLLSVGLGGILGALFKFVFEFLLPEQVRSRREAEARLRRYEYPLLHAADAVEHRLRRMLSRGVKGGWLRHEIVESVRAGDGFLRDPVHRQGYFFLSTLYVFARFFAWLEIMRREVVFLDYSHSSKMREFNRILMLVSNGFRNTDLWSTEGPAGAKRRDCTRLFRHTQSAIGECMIVEHGGDWDCISFREFATRYVDERDPAFRFWLRNLEDYFDGLGDQGRERDYRIYRLALLELAFFDLVRFLDPRLERVQERPDDHRARILSSIPAGEQAAIARLEKAVRGLPASLLGE